MENSRYKFRAWDKKQNKMIHPFYIGGDGEGHVIPAINDSSDTLCSDSVLMQCTGLLDKNGKEIFEGDVLFHYYYKEKGVVIWHVPQSRWALEYFDKKTQELFPIDKDSFEILGNIYEHSHLLEAKP